MDSKAHAQDLLDQWAQCCHAVPKHNTVEFQLEKDQCAKYAVHLHTQLVWAGETEIVEACRQFEGRLKQYKEKVIIEILQHGSV